MTSESQQERVPPTAPTPERRQVTVLFADLVNSSHLAARLDPEDFRDVLRAYQQCCVDAVEVHGGFIGQYLGDGIVAYFGYPSGQEDAAVQAVRAAVTIAGSVAALQIAAAQLQIRAGVATGIAILGDVIGHGVAEQAAITGEVAIRASRIQALAAPGAIVIADSTRRLVGRRFDCVDLGAHPLKGLPDLEHVWSVMGEIAHETRYDALYVDRSSELIGRGREIRFLRQRWREGIEGRAGAVLVVADAGVGKSMLVAAHRRKIEREGAAVAVFQCSPRHQESPLYPVAVFLRRLSGAQDADTRDRLAEKLHTLFSDYGLGARAGAMMDFLSGPHRGHAVSALDAAALKREVLDLLFDLLRKAAARAPLLVVVEDAHWADPTTRDFLDRLVTEYTALRMLAIVTTRPGYEPDWIGRASTSVLSLPSLKSADAYRLVESIVGERLSQPAVSIILDRADGVPLFLRELSHAAIEEQQSSHGIARSAVPMTLQDALVARIDRLGSGKPTAQAAAVLGRTFTADVLGCVLGRGPSQVAGDLRLLETAGLVRATDERRGGNYAFEHALHQEVAYGGLLRETRRDLHSRCAVALERLQPELAAYEPETLANHWDVAGNFLSAARYWLLAGQRALARAANLEAVTHFGRGLRAVERMNPADNTGGTSFELWLGMGQACYVVKGPAHADTVEAYTRAQNLLDCVRDPDQRARVLYGIFSGYHFASKFDLAETPARLMLELAERHNRRGDLCQGHRMLGYIAFFRGERAEAVRHFEALASRYRTEDHGALAYQYGADCLVGTQGFYAVIDSASGRRESAIARAEQNRAYAARLNHPASLGWAYAAACYVRYFSRDAEAALAISTEGSDYCRDNNISSWSTHCRLFKAWAEAMLNRPTDQADIVRALIAEAAGGNRLGLCLFRMILAEILLREGNAGAALRESETALREIAESGQLFFRPAALEVHDLCVAGINARSDA